MTREEFIKELERKGYTYKISENGDILLKGYNQDIFLNDITSMPENVKFLNGGSVWINEIEELPLGVRFQNGGFVSLNRLTCLPPDIKNIESLGGSGFIFSKSLFGGWADKWKGQIKGIDPNLLINKMIELGLFYKK